MNNQIGYEIQRKCDLDDDIARERDKLLACRKRLKKLRKERIQALQIIEHLAINGVKR